MPLLPPSRFAELLLEVAAATRPVTELKRWFANEIARATWELECVRVNWFHAAAEQGLNLGLDLRPLAGSNKIPKPLNASTEVQ